MSTMTHMHRSATWRPGARLGSRAVTASSAASTSSLAAKSASCIIGNHGTKPFTDKVNFVDFVPSRRGAPPL